MPYEGQVRHTEGWTQVRVQKVSGTKNKPAVVMVNHVKL